jgi:D-alanyl-D-alanine endopeptidase (penicillin-binding protein 7)
MLLVELISAPRRMLVMVFCLAAALAVSTEQVLEAAAQAKPKPKSTSSNSSRLTLSKARATTARNRRSSRSSRARSRAAATARSVSEAKVPHFKFDENGALVPDIRAEAAIIYDPRTGQVLWEQNSQVERSIASITKVMTAAVVLENPADLDTQVVIQRSDVYRASTTYIRAGDRVTKDDLLHLLLIGSDNAAAKVLARTSALGPEGFIRRMNEKAAELGLESTEYVDPAGLFNANVSSAYDMARLISFASSNERMASIMRTPQYSIDAGRRRITVSSTNQLVKTGDVDVQAGKTGFIRNAGYCLATLLRLPNSGGEVAVVVLGAKSNAGRFWETRHLFNWLSTKAEDLLGGRLEAAAPAAPAQ